MRPSREAGPAGPASPVRGYTALVTARARVWGGVLAACLLAAGSGTAAGGTRSAVLHGTVLVAPATPVCMPRVPCMRPAAGVVLAFSRAGAVRARVTSAADGSYRVALAPGTYAVRVTRPEGVHRLSPLAVSLSANQVKRVTFYLDTGIR
jgi:Carboxypeptidase regulatory-like domain